MVPGYHTVPIQRNPVLQRKLAQYVDGSISCEIWVQTYIQWSTSSNICLISVVPTNLIWVGEGLSYLWSRLLDIQECTQFLKKQKKKPDRKAYYHCYHSECVNYCAVQNIYPVAYWADQALIHASQESLQRQCSVSQDSTTFHAVVFLD